MKKVALILAMVCFVLSFAAAQEFAPEVKVEGNAQLTAGYNLDSSIFALNNSIGADLKLTLVPEASAEKAGEGLHGWIQMKEFKLEQGDVVVGENDDGSLKTQKGLLITNPIVNAKILYNEFFLTLQNEGTKKAIEAGGHSIQNLTDGNFILGVKGDNVKGSSGDMSYFFTGYDSENVDFTLKVGNGNDYCEDAEGADALWAFGAGTELAFNGLKVAADAVYAVEAVGIDPAVGASVSYEMALTEEIKLAPQVGFDAVFGDETTWAAGLGVFAKWGGEDKYKSFLADDSGACPITWLEIKHFGGAGVGVQYNSDSVINVVAQVVEQRGDEGLVPGLGAVIDVELSDVTTELAADMGMAFGAFVNYKVGNTTPYVRARYESAGEGSLAMGLGVEVGSVIPNTAILIDWNANDVMNEELGLLTAGVKISF